jgi:acyl-CoA thioester hydrolase
MSESARAHETSLRVRYGEVDRMGVAYHANYLVWFEQGRTEFLRALGGTYRHLEDQGTLLMVVETGVRHLKPAGYDDLVRVRTHLAKLRPVRLRFEYEVFRGEELLATGFTVLAATDRSGRPRRVPSAFRRALETRTGADGKAGAPTEVQARAGER